MDDDIKRFRRQCPIKLPAFPRGNSKGPSWVPVFTADDMAAYVIEFEEDDNGFTGRCDAYGWKSVLGIDEDEFINAYKKANNVNLVLVHHEDTCKTNKQRADALNRAMRELGYVHISD